MELENWLEETVESLFGRKEHEFVARGGSIQIGDGSIRLWEQTMPLDAVSMLDVTQPIPKSYLKPTIVLIISVLLVFIRPETGIFVLTGVIAAVVIACFYVWNQARTYFLDIYNHMGYRIRIRHRDKSFLINLKNQIEKCIKNRGMSLVINLSNKSYDVSVGDVMMGEARKYQAGGDIITEGSVKNNSGNVIQGNENVINQNTGKGNPSVNKEKIVASFNQAEISDEEWNLIMQFASTRKRDYAQGDKYYTICNYMQYYAQKKDENNFINLVKKAGKAVMDAVLSTCTSEAVISIINRVFHVG